MESSTNLHLTSSIFFLLIITVLLIFPTTTNSISFKFPNFPKDDLRISLENDSTRGDNSVIELTPNLDKAVRGSVGRATYSEPIQLWNATTGKVIDFVTHFSFIVTRTNLSNYGDGISFFLAPSGSKVPPRSSGGYLALFDRVNAEKKLPTNQIVAVEFDTFQNPWDPSTDHVGINVNSIISDAYVALENNSIKSGRTANAWVSYNSTAKNLSVYLTSDDNPVFNGNSILYHIIDLSKVLPEKITVGFSASTGWSAEIHRLISWQFNSSNLETDERKAESSKGIKTRIGFEAPLPKLPLELPSIRPVSLPTSPSRSNNLSLASLTDTLTGR